MTVTEPNRIRPGGEVDAHACTAIIATLPEYFTRDVVEQVRIDLAVHDSWMIEKDGSVVGFAIVRRGGRLAAEILWVAVAAARRNQGLGAALVERVLDDLRDGGTRVVEVKTLDPAAGYAPYTATHAFWAARGFVQVDTIDPLPGWEPGNPCAILVAALAPTRRS